MLLKLGFRELGIMKLVVFLIMITINFSAYSAGYAKQKDVVESVRLIKDINAKLLISINDDEKVNTLLDKREKLLDTLMGQLKLILLSKVRPSDKEKKISLLESKIDINRKKNNVLSVERDQFKVNTFKTELLIRNYLKFLIESSKNYESIEFISTKSSELFDESIKVENAIVLPDLSNASNNMALALKSNHMDLLKTINAYQDILMYVITNPRKIASIHWFQEFSLLSVISSINQFQFIQTINYKIAALRVDVGGVVMAIIIFLVVFSGYPYLFKCTSWFISNKVLNKESEHQQSIYIELRKPIRAFVVFYGLYLSAYSFFYKTDYRGLLDHVTFVIYSVVFIWFIFKVIDSFVLIQIQKFSSSDVELRKELFNLGVQTTKALVIIIVLTFGLSHFGISLTAIASTLGIGGFAFALAAKDTLSNLFGGITILFDNVFKLGDWIQIDGFEGTVAEIGLRSITIRTFDNALITIPNSMVSLSGVKNWNRRVVGRRIKMHIGVTYESNMNDIKQCIQDIREMLIKHPHIANPKQTQKTKRKKTFKFTSQEDTYGIKSTQLVFMDRYSDFSIDILIYCFAKTVNWADWLEVKEDVLFKVAEILEKNNLQFAYPTQVRIHRAEANNTENDILMSTDS